MPASLDVVELAPSSTLRRMKWTKASQGSASDASASTLAHGLADSPVGQLAWIVEKFKEWTHGAEVPEDAVDRDRMLTNVMIYCLTNTAGSSANLYYEGAHSGSWGPGEPSPVPTGVAVFAEDVAIRRYAEQGNNIVHWTDFDRGGHFAAMEVPDLLVGDVREFFRLFR